MRQKNLRLVIVGAVLIVAAIGFMFGMSTMAPKSNNSVAMMETVFFHGSGAVSPVSPAALRGAGERIKPGHVDRQHQRRHGP